MKTKRRFNKIKIIIFKKSLGLLFTELYSSMKECSRFININLNQVLNKKKNKLLKINDKINLLKTTTKNNNSIKFKNKKNKLSKTTSNRFKSLLYIFFFQIAIALQNF